MVRGAVELIDADEDLIRMTWYDCLDPFVLHMPPGTDGRPIGVFLVSHIESRLRKESPRHS